MSRSVGAIRFGSLLCMLMMMASVEWGGRLGSGDGERKTLLTQQISFEPLPARLNDRSLCFLGHQD
jgi:hypothetical protein